MTDLVRTGENVLCADLRRSVDRAFTIMFLFFNRRIVAGLTAGAIKG